MAATAPVAAGRILLIDDDELIAGSLCALLVRSGCTVHAATETSAADRLMNEAGYDVVVVDPYMTGSVHAANAALIDRVCAAQPEAAVVVLTAYPSPELVRSSAALRVRALLSKPQSIIGLTDFVIALAQDRRAGVPQTRIHV